MVESVDAPEVDPEMSLFLILLNTVIQRNW